jgi:predicted acetyltransferase
VDISTRQGQSPQAGGPAAARALRLRPPGPDDEAAVAAAHRVMAEEGFTFGLGYQPGKPWRTYLAELEDHRHGRRLAPNKVPATLLVADVAGEIVGRTSIRFALNDDLTRQGGHIGYCVLPAYRRRGYATEILRQSLVIARAAGLGPVLVTCDDDNLGSRAVIESCGGLLDSMVARDNGAASIRRYWIA